MISYHRKTICKLLDQIKFASTSPFENLEIWKNVQLIVLKKIIQLEGKIRDYNAEKKKLNAHRKNASSKLSKEESIKVKARIKKIETGTDSIRFVINAYRSVGDAIAFTLINKLDIKPQNFKQSAGFISEKTGLQKELESFHEIFNEGHIAILNDLTSTLKYCDITFIHPNGFIPIEVKSNDHSNNRVRRQSENASKIFGYLNTDKIEGLYGMEGITHRVELKSPEVNYIREFNELINDIMIKKNISIEVEPGIHYYVSTSFDGNFMDENFKDLDTPLMISFNQNKFMGQGYYPFSLSFLKSSDYFDFLTGKYVVFIFIELGVIDKLCQSLGYNFIFTEDPQFGFAIEPQANPDQFSLLKMSNHYIFRAAFEFVSLKWIIEDSINQYK